jgi:hypothetical protein
MEAAGSSWVSTNFSWKVIEPSNNSLNWSSFDRKVQNAQAAGMDVYVLFTGNPSWAAELPGGPVYNIGTLVDITRRAAERYDCDGVDDAPGSPCVHYWSFYGEPDNTNYARALRGKGYWGHNGTGYADMLAHVAPAIHDANPRAKVLIGGIAYDSFVEEGGDFVRSFLGDVLGALNGYPGGAKAYLDAIAFHYYPISTHRWPTILEKALEIRGIMSQYGVGDLPMICPEAGYWSSPKFGSNETIQARRVAQMYVRSMSAGVRPLMWYLVYDLAEAGSPEDQNPDETCGLFRPDGSEKVAYRAYRTISRELGRSYYRRPFQHPNIEGYVFQVADNREMTVLWATIPATNVSFPSTCLRRVYLYGGSNTITDGDSLDLDGSANGAITIRVEQNQATYVEPCH